MRILYLYNKEGWALHNVGILWFSKLPDGYQVDMLNYHQITDSEELFSGYDYVWFSYLYMYMKFNYDINKSIVSIHDPMELFPQVPNWMNCDFIHENLISLRKLRFISTISTELHDILEKNFINSTLMSTTSLLSPKDTKELSPSKIRIISIANKYPRKNLDLMYEIRDYCNKIGIVFFIKLGDEVLPETAYVDLIDDYTIYICTSFQEGGPIPAMDAMQRGLAVLTTPVGQMNELIEQGINGFICRDKKEFIEKIQFLKDNDDILLEMRKNSLENIKFKRDIKTIRRQALSFLETLK